MHLAGEKPQRKKSSNRTRATATRPGRTQASRARSTPKTRLIRYAVIGLGYIAQVAVLPAFANARRNSKLVALVSDNEEKLNALGARYRVNQLYRYHQLDQLLASGEIDAIYIALPNTQHASYAIKAAEAGIHVLTEKPLGVTASECQQIIAAAQRSAVKLMVAYRLHFDAATLEIAHLARSGQLGNLRYFTSSFSMQVEDGNIRLRRDTAGGPLYDIGIYCINAARMVFAADPTQVFATAATQDDPRFREVPETVAVTMKFPRNRVASFVCSFGAANRSTYEIVGTAGSLIADPAYPYAQGIRYELRSDGRTRVRQFKNSDQFAAELLYFSDCILNDCEPEPSGEEGLIDVTIIEALNESILSGRWVTLDLPQRRRRPAKGQAISCPAVKRPPLVAVKSPSRR